MLGVVVVLLLSERSFQVIGGSAAKRYGGKTILTVAVFLWSLSTFITPFFPQYIYLLIFMRVLLGIGEGLGQFAVLTT